MKKLSIAAVAAMALPLVSCVASWLWDWAPRIESGSESSFRDVTAICRVDVVNELDGLEVEPVLREELGFVPACEGESRRHLDVESSVLAFGSLTACLN